MVFGAAALGVANGAKLALQMAVLPIIARILGPSAFGLVAIAMPFILLSNLLCDAGMGTALMRHPNPSRELESTVFWLCIAAGGALSLLICAVAWPLAVALSQPTLAPVLAVLSIILIISSSLSVANAKVSRERRLGVFGAGELIAAVASAGAGLLAAMGGWGLWSLVVQQIVLWATKAVWLFLVSGFRPTFVCRPELAGPFLGFGANVVGASLADFAGRSLPSVVVGALLGVAAAGHYAMGLQLTRLPEMVLSGPIYLSTFAAVARTGADRAAAAALTVSSLRLLLALAVPLFCGLALVADLGTDFLLGPTWAPAAGVIVLLAPGALLLCVYTFFGAVLMGGGRSDRKFRLTILLAIASLAGAVAGAAFGVRGVAAGLSLAALLALPFYVRNVAAELKLSLRAIAITAGGPLLATLAMAAAVGAVRRYGATLSAEALLALAVAVGAATYLAVLAPLGGRQVLRDAVRLFSKPVTPPAPESLAADPAMAVLHPLPRGRALIGLPGMAP